MGYTRNNVGYENAIPGGVNVIFKKVLYEGKPSRDDIKRHDDRHRDFFLRIESVEETEGWTNAVLVAINQSLSLVRLHDPSKVLSPLIISLSAEHIILRLKMKNLDYTYRVRVPPDTTKRR